MQTFQEHMMQHTGLAIQHPILDGQWHNGKRTDGKGADKIGYVCVHAPKGLLVRYRNCKTDEVFVWKEWGDQDRLEDTEYQARRVRAHQEQAKREQTLQLAKAQELHSLQAIWSSGVPAKDTHPYLLAKRIPALAAKQANKSYLIKAATHDSKAQYINPDDLLIPIYNAVTGALQGLQQIKPNGFKLVRGQLAGGLCWIGGDLMQGEVTNRLYIAEGYATAVSVHVRTKNPIIMALSTTNLMQVGQWARQQYPDAQIVFAVDNDLESSITVQGQAIQNPGLYYASKAAEAIGGAWITPPTDYVADWNDWHVDQLAAWEERAAIIEYDGVLSREDAERLTSLEIKNPARTSL
jgi:putative DNA primase/helicase